MKKLAGAMITLGVIATGSFYFYGNATSSKTSLDQKAENSALSAKRLNLPPKERHSDEGLKSQDSTSETKQEEKKAELLKMDPNGTRVYMVGDTQITVAPDGELFYLPAKI